MRANQLLLLAAYRSPVVLRSLLALRAPDRAAYVDNERWEREYKQNGWNWLWSPREALHHRVIAGYCETAGGPARVLDMGCGEGVLTRVLRNAGIGLYIGVDLSPTAISRASVMADAETRFLAADINEFDTAEIFDRIVFNESIYYLGDPSGTLRRLSRHLSDGGMFIVSTSMDSLRGGLHMLDIWRALERDLVVVDEVAMLHGHGGSLRIIKALAPRKAGSAPII